MSRQPAETWGVLVYWRLGSIEIQDYYYITVLSLIPVFAKFTQMFIVFCILYFVIFLLYFMLICCTILLQCNAVAISVYLSVLLRPLLFPSSSTYTHLYWAVIRMASLATIQSPQLCPLACHPYTKQETNMHIGMWAQTKVRLSLIHIQPGRLSSNRPLHPPPHLTSSFPSPTQFWMEENLSSYKSHMHIYIILLLLLLLWRNTITVKYDGV